MNEKTMNQIYFLISKNFGDSVVDGYKEFYKKRTDQEIFKSVEELLTELVGPKNAQEQLSEIKLSLKKTK